MENKICDNCSSFFVITDHNKQKHYFFFFLNMVTRPSKTCEYWNQAKHEREVEDVEEDISTTIRVWNPRSKRHEDVKAE